MVQNKDVCKAILVSLKHTKRSKASVSLSVKTVYRREGKMIFAQQKIDVVNVRTLSRARSNSVHLKLLGGICDVILAAFPWMIVVIVPQKQTPRPVPSNEAR